jgi:hypothetical protein
MNLHNLWIALMGLTCLARKEEVIEEECKPEMKYWNDRHCNLSIVYMSELYL